MVCDSTDCIQLVQDGVQITSLVNAELKCWITKEEENILTG
jgi:hypothetical protein